MLLFFSEKLNIEIGDFSKEKLEDLMKKKSMKLNSKSNSKNF